MTARYQGVAVAPGNGLIYVIGGWNNGTPTQRGGSSTTRSAIVDLGSQPGASERLLGGGSDQRPDLRFDGLR